MAERSLRVTLIGDDRDLQRSFQRSAAGANKLEREFKKTAGRADVLNQSLRGVLSTTGKSGFLFGSGAFVATASLTALLKASSSAASDLNEQTNKARVVFGASSRAVEDFARNALLLSRDAALEAAGTFGALLRPLGETQKEAARTSVGLVKLAQDLSSFHNVDPAQVLLDLRSGLVGEVEPLRKYGIRLSEARVQQEALRETGKTNVKALTDQEKVVARLILIYRDSKTAQGDAARTSGGLANQQRALEKNVRNLEAAIGTALNPVILDATKHLNAWLGNSENQERVQKDLSEAVKIGSQVVKDFAGVASGAAHAVGGFKNLVELLLALKVASVIAGWTGALTRLGTAAGEKGAAGKVGLLTRNLQTLKTIGPVAAIVALKITGDKLGVNEDFSPENLLKTLNPFKNKGPALNFVLGKGFESDAAKRARDAGEKAGSAFKSGFKANADIGFREFTQGLGFRDPELLKPIKKAKEEADKIFRFTPEQRNTFFDNLIGRREDRVQDIASLRGQAAELLSIASRITAEIKRVSDPTRKQTLTDDLVRVQRDRKKLLEQIVQNQKDAADALRQSRIDAISLLSERAQGTPGLKDDLRAAQQMTAELRKQISANKTNVDLQRQLVESQQNEAEIRKSIVQQRKSILQQQQFSLLGLGPTGEAKVPGLGSLRKVLDNVTDAIAGTNLNTQKRKALLGNIRAILVKPIKDVSPEVRSAIQGILGDIDRQIKQHSDKTRNSSFHVANTDAVLGGLGLSPDQLRAARARLAQIGVGGTIHGASAGSAFGFSLPTIHLESRVEINDNVLGRAAVKYNQRRGRRFATQTTGPHAGNATGSVH